MNDPPLAKGDIGGFSKHLNPPLPPFSKGGDANKYMLRVICPKVKEKMPVSVMGYVDGLKNS
jgi:hypothetical protein